MHSILRRFLTTNPRISIAPCLQSRGISTQNFTPLALSPALTTTTSLPHMVTPRTLSTRNFIKPIKHSPAVAKLLNSLKDEIGYQTSMGADLPEIDGFQSSIKDLQATFTRETKSEKISISVNASEKIIPEIGLAAGMDQDGMMDMDGNQTAGNEGTIEGEEHIYLPVININIDKPSGHRLEIDCSFNPSGESLQEILESDLQINEVRVVHPGTPESDEIYSLEGTNFDDGIYDGVIDYLEEKGVNNNFLNQLIQYYQVFERRIYINEFLNKMTEFLKK